MTDLLGKFPDLMEEFNYFLLRCENVGDFVIYIIFYVTLSCFCIIQRCVVLTRFILTDGFLAGIISTSMFIHL